MKCPKCSTEITQPAASCRHCGFVFSERINEKLSIYFGLKNEFINLSAAKNRLQYGLERIDGKIARYERLLEEDLKGLARMTPEKMEKKEAPKAEAYADLEEVKEPERPIPEKLPRGIPVEPGKAIVREIAKPEKERPKKTSTFEIRLGQKWLLIVGVITMVFGIGYFLKYSFERGWISPPVRIAMAYAWGIILLIGGERFRRKKLEAFGLCLMGGGLAVLYFSAFAGFRIYPLIGHVPSFFIMISITVLASVLAVLFDTRWLAALALLGGFLTPKLLSTGEDYQVALMTYVTVLNLGILGMAFYKKWALLNFLGFAATYLLYIGWHFKFYEESKFWPAIIFLTVFYLIYSAAPFAYQFFRDAEEKLKGLFIITPNTFIAFGFSYVMIKEHFSLEWVGVVTVFYAAVFILMAFFLYRKGIHRRATFEALIVQAALFLVITAAIVLSKHWITIAWAAEALIFLWIAVRLKKLSLAVFSYLILCMTASKFLFYDYRAVFGFMIENLDISGGYAQMLAERYLTAAFLLALGYRFGRMVRKNPPGAFVAGKADESVEATIVFTLWLFALFVILNIETIAFFTEYGPGARLAAVSVLWTLFSIGMIVKGFVDNNAAIRVVSLVLFLITLVKVFIFDMAQVATPYRILSFIVLGLVMILCSYLYYRFKDKIMEALESVKKEYGT